MSYLSQPVLRRDSSGPSFRRWRARKSYKRASRDVQAMFKRVKRERERGRASSFKLSVFGHRPQAAGPIRASVRGGAPPMSKLSGVDVHVIQYFINSVEDTNLQILYACLVTHDAKA